MAAQIIREDDDSIVIELTFSKHSSFLHAEEQIQDQLSAAVESAARAQGMTLVISPDVVLFAEASHNMNQAVLAQLNTLLPSAQLVPPAGWLPREMREQQEAAAAAQPAAGGAGR